ncbi:MAG: hypothetical protein QG672_1738 [Pseudomonadota bacterium]|nr:hypothetical protein [Pseudomonadota bacterium]
MRATVTKLDVWRAAHSRPVVIDYCRWSQAVETVARANLDAWFTLTFLWPRILLRSAFGV